MLLTAGTALVANHATGAGKQYMALGGVTTYLLPAPPAHWIPGQTCLVYREGCERDIKGNPVDPACETTSSQCMRQAVAGEVNVSGTPCRPTLSNQPCDWANQPELVDGTVQVSRIHS